MGLHGSQLIPWHLQAGMCRTEHRKGKKPHNSVLEKGRASTGAVTAALAILRVLAYSTINSQAASAPQLTQKQKRADPRVQGLHVDQNCSALGVLQNGIIDFLCRVANVLHSS